MYTLFAIVLTLVSWAFMAFAVRRKDNLFTTLWIISASAGVFLFLDSI